MDCHKVGHITLGEHSRWVGENQVSVKVRKIGRSSKIAVDLQVLSPQVTYAPSYCELKKIACRTADLYGIVSHDYSVLSDVSTEQKTRNASGVYEVTHVRNLSLAFATVEE